MITITRTSDDLRRWIGAAAEAAGITDPVVFTAGKYLQALLRASVPGPFLPLDGVLLREWERSSPFRPGARFGLRLYTAAGIRYVRCFLSPWSPSSGCYLCSKKEQHDLFVVSTADYIRLYRLAVLHCRRQQSEVLPPVMQPEHLELLRQHTIDYLNWKNLRRIRELGGRPRRSVLLVGPPGNGKTTTCRWLRAQCERLGLEHKEITYKLFSRTRYSYGSSSAAIKKLFLLRSRGIIFLDDMHRLLQHREAVPEFLASELQSSFLRKMDGLEVNEGVVYVITTNCPPELIAPEFKRPGRIDLVLPFKPPTPELRRQLIDRWHADIRGGIDIDRAVSDTDEFSFAEMEEVKNLLILRHQDTGRWEWDWALQQFRENRESLAERERIIGFGAVINRKKSS